MGFISGFKKLYNSKENWFTIKYSAQINYFIIFTLITYFALQIPADQLGTSEENSSNVKKGLVAALFVFLFYQCLKPYTGPFYKPHEGLWRFISGIGIVYVAILTFLAFQNANFARTIFKYIDSTLGVMVRRDLHTNPDQCNLTIESFLSNFDHYYACHFIGWFMLTLEIRDVVLVNFFSIMHEVLELSLQHILPQFTECWWDHLIIDLILSNSMGIFLASYIMGKLGITKYDWLGRNGAKSISEWKIFQCHRRFGGMLYMSYGFFLQFIDSFLLMNSLFIPPVNIIAWYRISMWALLSYLPYREIYIDVSTWGTPDRKANRVEGKYRWMAYAMTYIELLVGAKFWRGSGIMNEDAILKTPIYIWFPWLSISLALVVWFFVLRFKKTHTKKYAPSEIKKD